MTEKRESIFRNSSLYKTFIESGDDFEEVDKVLRIELEKFMSVRKFKKFNKNYENFDVHNIHGYINCCTYFGLSFTYNFFEYIFEISFDEKWLHKIYSFWYFKEKADEYVSKNYVGEDGFYLFGFTNPTSAYYYDEIKIYPKSVKILHIANGYISNANPLRNILDNHSKIVDVINILMINQNIEFFYFHKLELYSLSSFCKNITYPARMIAKQASVEIYDRDEIINYTKVGGYFECLEHLFIRNLCDTRRWEKNAPAKG